MAGPECSRQVALDGLSTFALPATAAELVVIDRPEHLPDLPPFSGPELILGGGSNTVFMADWPGRILLNRLRGLRFEALPNDRVRVHAGGGENWHRLVRHCLDREVYGLENLALIPGTVGAAPVQNIGAYGVELDQFFESLSAWDRHTHRWVELNREDCGFAYRDSRFKSLEPGRFLITEVRLLLSRSYRPRTDYPSLKTALRRAGIERPKPRELVATIIRLRRLRLPDPARLANVGSFFKNPLVSADEARRILSIESDLAHWPQPDGRVKLAAGAMLERLGFKGFDPGPIGVHRHHALVLVHRGGGRAEQLRELVDRLLDAVEGHFGIVLEIEPRLVTTH